MCIRDSYWTVDGLWPEGTALNGRVYYHGDPGGLDEDLYGSSETDALLVYRAVSYTHLRAHETVLDLVCRLLLEKKK